jgi:hypothetical protein
MCVRFANWSGWVAELAEERRREEEEEEGGRAQQ